MAMEPVAAVYLVLVTPLLIDLCSQSGCGCGPSSYHVEKGYARTLSAAESDHGM